MKKISIIVLFTLVCSYLHAQDTYFIQNIKGVVKNGNSPVKKGDKIDDKSKLTFAKGALLMVSSQKEGMKILPAKPVSSETAYTLADLLPQTKRASTRSSAFIQNPKYFENYFGDGIYCIFGEDTQVKVNLTDYPMNKDSYFSLRYDYNNEIVDKKLTFVGDQFIIAKKELFSVKGKEIDSNEIAEFALHYHNGTKKSPNLVASFMPLFIPVSEELKTEIAGMVAMFKEETPENRQKYFNDFRRSIATRIAAENTQIPEEYKENLNYWLEKNFDLKAE
jgi:hypothetical protein